MKWKSLRLIFVLALLLLGGGLQVGAAVAQSNLLQNPGFEFPYHSDGAASGWIRWHRNSSEELFADCTNGYHKRPHWSAETTTAALIHSGGASQHVGNQWDTWAAGVWQNVNVTPGSRYRFTVYARGFGSSEDYPAPSEAGLQMNIQVGVDPNGSGLWYDSDVQWSNIINPHDQWQPVSVEVTATGNTISVFTVADWGVVGVNQCRKHLDVWFDSAELIEVGPPPTNTPPPQPTSAPQPVAPVATQPPPPPAATDTPQVEPTDTPVPATDTPTPLPGGTICVNAFADTNANGIHDEDEGYMGNVTFNIASDSRVVGQAVSPGSPQAVCFEGLEAGSYQVAQIVPGRLEMTTAANASITIEEGQTISVEFGSRVRQDAPAPAPADEVADASTPAAVDGDGGIQQPVVQPASSLNLAALSGLLVMIVAIVLLGVLIFLVLRRQTS